MTKDAEIVTGDPRWYNFSTGASPLVYFFTGVEAGAVGGAVGRDVADVMGQCCSSGCNGRGCIGRRA